MSQLSYLQTTVILFGLEDELAAELVESLAPLCAGVQQQAFMNATDCLGASSNREPTLVFCAPRCEAVRQLCRAHPQARIIVVSRLPEVLDWLDALEAGANDYCAAPFEAEQIRWVLETNLVYSQAAA